MHFGNAIAAIADGAGLRPEGIVTCESRAGASVCSGAIRLTQLQGSEA